VGEKRHPRGFSCYSPGTGNFPSPNQIVVPKEQIMAVHDPLNDKVDEIKATMAMLSHVPVDLSCTATAWWALSAKAGPPP
jgi:hypothetical protein